MNRKIAGAMLAVIAVITAAQTADAKPKNWNDNGAYYGNNQNFNDNHGANRNPNGFNNGNAAWKNNYSNGYSNWGNQTYGRNDRNNWGNQSGYNNNWGNQSGWGFNQPNWGNNNNRFNNVRNIDQVQQRLTDRIARGISSGRLTQAEAERIRSMETRINTLETQFRSDNRLSYNERQRLSTELNKLQDRLRRELSDRQML